MALACGGTNTSNKKRKNRISFKTKMYETSILKVFCVQWGWIHLCFQEKEGRGLDLSSAIVVTPLTFVHRVTGSEWRSSGEKQHINLPKPCRTPQFVKVSLADWGDGVNFTIKSRLMCLKTFVMWPASLEQRNL